MNCANPSEEGASLCTLHKKRRKEKDTAQALERKLTGKCKCGLQVQDNALSCPSCKEKRRAYLDQRNADNLCRYCDNAKLPDARYCAVCAEYYSSRNRLLRQKVYDHYGNYCACCGETISEFFAIDHVNNDGNLDRQKGIKSQRLILKIIRESFPDFYQILCHNCNFAKSFCKGGCPHKRRLLPDNSNEI